MKLFAVLALIASLYAAPSRGMPDAAVTLPEPAGESVQSLALRESVPSAPVQESVQASPAQVKRANRLLKEHIARYPLLEGTSVSFGDTPEGHQAVAYYTTGRILIDPEHTAPLAAIIDHEIWHIIDWRDNGRIDFEEDVPPNNATEYER